MSLASDLAEYRHLRAIVRGYKPRASGRIWYRTPQRLIVQQHIRNALLKWFSRKKQRREAELTLYRIEYHKKLQKKFKAYKLSCEPIGVPLKVIREEERFVHDDILYVPIYRTSYQVERSYGMAVDDGLLQEFSWETIVFRLHTPPGDEES